MKTKIIIEIESKFNPIYPKDEEGELDEDNEVTEEVEKDFHKMIDNEIRQFIEDNLEENIFDSDQPEYSVEEYDGFTDYGKLSIKIITEELGVIKNE